MGKKFYAVRDGRSTGVYSSWQDCEEQVSGYSGARFKSFQTRAEANAFVKSGSNTTNGRSSRGNSSSNSQSGSNYSGRRTNHDNYDYAVRSSPRTIYTDGSSLGNGNAGARAGWGVYWGENDPRNSAGKVTHGEQTNNRGELAAINHALKSISKDSGGRKEDYRIKADSQYARDSIGRWGDNWEQNGWKTSKGTPVKNQDLIQSSRQRIGNLRNQGVNVSISYVPAHSGHDGNEAADKLARDAAGSS